MSTRALRRAFNSAPNDEQIIETLELSHSMFSKTWYLASNSTAPTPYGLETGAQVLFQPLPFTVKLPNSDAQGGQTLSISLANAGREMVQEIEAAATKPDERIVVVYRVYLLSDLSYPQNLPIRLSLDSIAMTDEAIQAQAGRSDVLNFKFPNKTYVAQQFPGLDR